MKAKPAIRKADDGWFVELPPFGFSTQPTRRTGFVSRQKAGEWLATQRLLGNASQLAERTTTPESYNLRYGARWPLVIR